MGDRAALHVLVPNNARQAPYADRTVCGIDLNEYENTLSAWPDELSDPLPKPDKWSRSGYRWCARCKAKAKKEESAQ